MTRFLRSLAHLNEDHSLVVSYALSLLTIGLALMFDASTFAVYANPQSLLHPWWIMMFGCGLNASIRAVTNNFEVTRNPYLVSRAVIGPLQLFTGAAILGGAIITAIRNENSMWLLWIGVTFVFWYFGTKNIAGVVYILQGKAFEREQVRRVKERQANFATQDALEVLEYLENDLSDFLADKG